jgi:hypothetical protein
MVFVVFSLVFGLCVIFVMPPLRGPDEIAHFLRIYSYTRIAKLTVAQAMCMIEFSEATSSAGSSCDHACEE